MVTVISYSPLSSGVKANVVASVTVPGGRLYGLPSLVTLQAEVNPAS